MVEKRRGLGRGLGAPIPSAPAEESTPVEEDIAPPVEQSGDEAPGKGRPADLFFERVTEDDVANPSRSYSAALKSSIERNMRDAQTKRTAKPASSRRTARATRSDETPANAGTVSAEEKSGTTSTSKEVESSSAVQGAATMDSRPSSTPHADVSAGAQTQHTEPGASPKADPEGSGEPVVDLVSVPGAEFAELELDAIHPNRKQPRVEFDEDELAELVLSIREIGVLQPVVVRPSQEGGAETYELVMGERRWRASREAGLDRIPAIIRSTLDDDLLRDALLENLHRSALNPLEEAAAYQQLLEDFGCSHDELAGRLGRSRPQISNTLRLMKLPPLVQRRVAAGVLSAGHARALLGLSDAAEMEKLAQKIVAEGLSVRSTEEVVALSGGLRKTVRPARTGEGARHERLDYLATSLSDRLDTNVKITLGAKKGRVSIEFASVDDLNRIVGVLSPKADS
ncbi:chromosome partitioning protein ParB [Arthrobacter sp. RIT-PI-e]|uniref:ParB/RepB/Spo0J family partition protein n=1 Tax=Arthrobacter sp. RIT-PI-e TaxID=1681197 RepID=UPI000675DC61|nr:ParB/RepB/Spo0J family partition protein [Arthrobacter sp. RIT-PI-e]KNC19458.1 chromosome partitioning protein ParB [Arthrobacter sp. RIT-PI-e]